VRTAYYTEQERGELLRIITFDWIGWRRAMLAYATPLDSLGTMDHPGDRADAAHWEDPRLWRPAPMPERAERAPAPQCPPGGGLTSGAI